MHYEVCCEDKFSSECIFWLKWVISLSHLFVLFFPQVGWRITVKWMAGNFACKAFLFLRAFGLYLSSNVLICVSLDRYFAVLHPLRVTDARRRGRMMLACAWGFSLVCSFPQVNKFELFRLNFIMHALEYRFGGDLRWNENFKINSTL